MSKLTIEEIEERAKALHENEIALKANLDSIVIPEVPMFCGSVDS